MTLHQSAQTPNRVTSARFWTRLRIGVAALTAGTVVVSGGILLVEPTAAAETQTSQDGMVFVVDNDHPEYGATVTSYDGGHGTSVSVPNEVIVDDIEYPVTVIGPTAFSYNSTGVELTDVRLPDHLTTIQYEAFEGNQLQSIQLPAGVHTIESTAFAKNALSSVTFPMGVSSVGSYAFYDNNLTALVLPDGLTTIEQGAFEMNALTQVQFPSSLTTIEGYAFSDNQFGSVTIPENVAVLGEGAFANNPSLASALLLGPPPEGLSDAGPSGTFGEGQPPFFVQFGAQYGSDLFSNGYSTPEWRGYSSRSTGEVTVTFDLGGHGAPIAPIAVAAGSPFVAPADPTDADWLFEGWWQEPTFVTPAAVGSPVDSDTVYHAKWVASSVINVPDDNLRACINQELREQGYPEQLSDRPIPSALANSLPWLTCSQGNITDATGLESFPSLTRLVLDGNNITVMPNLESLTELTDLSMSHNQLTHLAGIVTLPRLETLVLQGNAISDIDGLESMTRLRVLDLKSNQVESLEPLRDLVSLRELNVESNRIADLSPLSDLALQGGAFENQSVDLRVVPAEFEFSSPITHFDGSKPRLDGGTDLTYHSDAQTYEWGHPGNHSGTWSDTKSLNGAEYTFSGQFFQPTLEANVLTHTVTFDLGGFGQVIEPMTIPDDITLIAPQDPTDSVMSFAGWFTDASFATAFDFSVPITADTVLYAKWDNPVVTLDIPDAGLRTCINDELRNNLGYTEQLGDNAIPEALAAEVIDLESCRNRDISDVTGVTLLTNLETLDLSENPLTELPSLAPLNKLYRLTAVATQLSDLSPVFEATALKQLVIGQNPMVTTLDGISALSPTLNTLDLADNSGLQNADFAELNSLTGLFSLDVSNTAIRDFDQLNNLTSLYRLSIEGTETSDLTFVSAHPGLVQLNIHNNQISNLAPLAALHGLGTLGANINSVADLSPLADLPLTIASFDDQHVTLPSAVAGDTFSSPIIDATGLAVSFASVNDLTVEDTTYSWASAGEKSGSWSTTAKLSSPGMPFSGTFTQLVHPVGNHTVSFDLGGHGEDISAQTVVDGGAAIAPTEPAEEGWTFDGWYVDAEFTSEFDFASAITANTTIYAKWYELPAPAEHSVTFDLGGHGEAIAEQTVPHGTVAAAPAEPTEPGWVFDGWFADESWTTEFDFGVAISMDTVVYAKWSLVPASAQYTVSFDLNGHGLFVPPQVVVGGSAVAIPETPFEAGWVFEGWYADSGFTTEFAFAGATLADTVVYAKWSEMPAPIVHSVSFELGGHGEAISTQQVLDGGVAAVPTTPSETGWIFDGWFSEAAFVSEFDFDRPVDADTIVYAKWTELSAQYTVTFDLGGHGEAIENQSVVNGGSVTVPAEPSANGWTFDGWFVDAAFSAEFDFGLPVTGDTVLYAKWSVIPAADFEVSFDLGGHGDAVDSQTVVADGLATVPADPSELGWLFGGWFADAAFVSPFDFSEAITADTVVYAKWSVATAPDQYTVSFDLGGHGDAVSSQVVVHGAAAVEPAAPTEPGWVFEGWFGDAAFVTPFDFSGTITADTVIYAKWSEESVQVPTEFEVRFDLGGHGDMVASQTVLDGGLATVPADPSELGWIFEGWFADTAFVSPFDFSEAITADTMIYAKWSEVSVPVPTEFEVRFDLGGHGDAVASQTVLDGGLVTVPADPSEPGWVFGGWFADALFATSFDFAGAITADTVVYAKWSEESVQVPSEFEVRFDLGGHGDAVASQTVVDGAAAVEPAAPSEPGWAFEGWFTDAAFVTPFDFSEAITADTVIYAKWSEVIVPVPTEFEVRFDLGSHGDVVASQTVVDGGLAVVPADPSETGWVFDGWFTDATFATPFDFSEAITADTVVYAKWHEASVPVPAEFEVRFDLGGHGDVVASQVVVDGGLATVPADPSEPGWVFDGWFADALFATSFDFTQAITADTVVYAKWSEESAQVPSEFEVCFDLGGHGDAVASQTVVDGGLAVVPADPSETGWVFDGWFTDATFATPFDFAEAITADTVVYAKWSVVTAPDQYTVSFDLGGHGDAVSSQVVVDGAAAVEPAAPSEPGWVFDGWFGDATFVTPFDFSEAITADTVIYAKWSEVSVPVPTEFEVRFDLGGHGDAVASQTVLDGGRATVPADPFETGWVFEGWFGDATFVTPFDFSEAITADTMIYAKWSVVTVPDQYTVSFDLGGHGGAVSSQVVVDGAAAVEPAAPSEPGWVFEGWFADATFVTPFDFSEAITTDTVIYAKWSEESVQVPTEFEVRFDLGGHGDAVASQTVLDGGLATVPTDPSEPGWVFEGWFADAAFAAEFDFGQPISANTTVYAKWSQEVVNPPMTTSISIPVNTEVRPGETITATIAGLAAGTEFVVTMHSAPVRVASGVADQNGAATAAVLIPENAESGVHTLTLDVAGVTVATSEKFVVSPKVTQQPTTPTEQPNTNPNGNRDRDAGTKNVGGLAVTGSSDSTPLMSLTVLLLGAALVLLSRRRAEKRTSEG